MFEVKINCMECGVEHQVTDMVNKREMKFEETGESIWLTYFDCPSCGARNFVQADDANTNELLKREINLMIKALEQKKYGKMPRRKQSEKFKRVSNDLAKSRRMLMVNLAGKRAVDPETNERFDIYFNICQ